MTNASALAAATPDSRDRYVDLLRVASLAVVVVGHWLMAVVVIGRDGSVTATNVLALLPWLQPADLAAAGDAGVLLRRRLLARHRAGVAATARRRVRRLRPLPGRPAAAADRGLRRASGWRSRSVLEITGHDRGVLRLATQTVAQPLWFVGVYLGVIALAPPMLRLHRRLRAGRRGWPCRWRSARRPAPSTSRASPGPCRTSAISTSRSSGSPSTSSASSTPTGRCSRGGRRLGAALAGARTGRGGGADHLRALPGLDGRHARRAGVQHVAADARAARPRASGSSGWSCCCAARCRAGCSGPGSGPASSPRTGSP